VLAAVRAGTIDPVVSWELVEELVGVLRRPKLARYRIHEDDVEALLALLAPFLPTVELALEPRDPDDAPVIAAAVAGGAEAIVTGDADLLDDPALRKWLQERAIEVLEPGELLTRLQSD
jgi:putative PIN family toxin of toxin-antitoxin system